MKIISKVKDFYDWVVGIYGEDPKMVYDRRSEDTFVFAKYLKENTYWSKSKDGEYPWISCWVLMGMKIWDFKFHPVYNSNSDSDPKLPNFKYEWKTPKELIYEWENEKRHIWKNQGKPYDGDLITNRARFLKRYHICDSIKHYPFSNTKISEKDFNIPVLLCIDNKPILSNPILKNTPLESFIPAEDAFLSIQDFIGSLKDMSPEDKRNDIQKLESAGFDKKTSFRKM